MIILSLCGIVNIMIREEEESSEEEGFYKPPLKVHEHKLDSPTCVSPDLTFSHTANDLISHHNRPEDYLPRVLTVAPPIKYITKQSVTS